MISICLATYNGEKYIKELIESILPQLSVDDEIIVSDDKSTDSTIEIIRSIQDNRIKIFENKKNLGYSKNFESAILKSKGDIIFISDQDDVWLDNKIAVMTQALEDSDVVISDVIVVDENLEKIEDSHFKKHKVRSGFWVNFLKTRYIGSSMAFRRKILAKVLPFPKNSKYSAYDYWITIVSELYYNTKLVFVPTMLYRRHDSNASSGGSKSQFSIFRKVFTRFYSFLYLLSRI